jgi:hypothetical protein
MIQCKMYRLTLQEARKLAKEFIRRSEECMKQYGCEDAVLHVPAKTKETSAMVRASMELTRKLSDLRQNR